MKFSELEEGLQLIFQKEMSQQHGEKDSFYFKQGDTTKRLISIQMGNFIDLFSTLAEDNKLKSLICLKIF